MSTLAASVVVLTSVAGVGVATARSLPGDPFYGVKRATEAVQLWATPGDDEGQASPGVRSHPARRGRQAAGDSPYLASTLKAMNAETREGSADLLAAYKASGSIAPLAEVVSFARKQYTDLAKLGTRSHRRSVRTRCTARRC